MRAIAAALFLASGLWSGPAGATTAIEAALAADAALTAAAGRLDAAESPPARAAALGAAAGAAEAGLAAMREGLRRAATREATLEAALAAEGRARLRRLAALRAAETAPAAAWGAREAALATARRAGVQRAGVTAAAERGADLARRLGEARRRRARQGAARAALRGALAALQAARAELATGGPGAAPLPRIVTAEAALAEFVDAAGGAPPARLPRPRPPAPGTLTSPLEGGRPVSRFGAPDTLGQPTPGLRLAARAPATVRAPTTASVRFAGPLAGFGTVAILELGPGRLLTLAGLDALAVEAGETVREGAVIGHLGVTVSGAAEFPVEAPGPEGAGSSAILYAETREGGRPVDPRGWFEFQGKAGSP